MIANSPTLPSQVEKLIEKIKLRIDSNPLDERLVLVGQSSSHRESSEKYSQSYDSSVLIQPDKVDSLLNQVKGITSKFSRLGRPVFYLKKGDEKNIYEVSTVFDEKGIQVEAFVIEKEDPTLYLIFEPRQDFTLNYSLFDKTYGHNRIWKDHLRGVNEVITFERQETKSVLNISKNYILDYLFLRKKALLLHSYLMLVVKAEDDVPNGFRQEFNITEKGKRATITVVRDLRYGEQLVLTAEIIKTIFPPSARTLGDFGVLPQVPMVTFKTTNGVIDMKQYNSHNFGDFLSIAFFNSDVLKKYEDDLRYRIDDNGGVHYRGVWGIFRGIWRVGDEIIGAHLGDLVEGLPFEELPLWAAYNIDPLSSSEISKYRQISPISKLVNDLLSELEAFNYRKNILIRKNGILDNETIIKTVNQNSEVQIPLIKNTFTSNTTKEEFLHRTVTVYKLVIDNLNLRLLQKIADYYNSDYKFDEQGKPLGSLKLFLVCLKLMKAEEMCKESGITGDVYSKVNKYFDILNQSEVDATGNFLLAQIQEKFKELEQSFSVLFTIYAFRTKSGGAHPGSGTEFITALKSLGFEENQTNYLPVYRTLIVKLTQFLLEA